MRSSRLLASLTALCAATVAAQTPSPPVGYAAPPPPPPPPPRGLAVATEAEGARHFPPREPVSPEVRVADLDLVVAPSGAVLGCRVVRGSGSPALDDASCTFAQASRLQRWEPAPQQPLCCAPGEVRWVGRNATLVMWHREIGPRVLNQGAIRYPEAALRADLRGTTIFSIDLDNANRVADCRIVQSSGHPVLDTETCRFMREEARVQPGTDRYGQPVTKGIRGPLSWRIAAD